MIEARAIGTAVVCSVVLCAVGLLGPTGAAAVLVALPLPSLVLTGIYGTMAALLSAALTAVLVGSALGTDAACFYLALAGIPVAVTVWALQHGYRIETVVALAVAVLVGTLAGLFLASYGSVAALQSAIAGAWTNSFDRAIELYRTLGMPEDQLMDIESQRAEFDQGLLPLFPAVAILVSAAVWLVNLRFSSRWVPWPQLQNLKQWQAPPWLIWTLIVSGFAMFFPHPVVAVVARNLFIVVLAGYFCQGLAIVSYFLQRLGLPPGLRVASYLLIGLQEIVAGVVLALGVFDFWGNFRRLGVPSVDADTE
jgi:hypothetical protein